MRLWVATVERAATGCELSDGSLAQSLTNTRNYEFDETRVEMLMDYVRYLDTPSGPRAQPVAPNG